MHVVDQDGAEPSPNSFSAHNLRRLSTYLPSKLVEPTPADIFKAFREMMNEYPVAIPEMLSAFAFHSKLPKQVTTKRLILSLYVHVWDIDLFLGSYTWFLGHGVIKVNLNLRA